jgi:hypothetical protein
MRAVPDLERFSPDDLPHLGDAIRGFANAARSMEHSANLVADLLWDELRDGQGEPACALLRVYKTHRYRLLPDDLKEFARGLLDADPPPDTRCLTLLATRGVEPAWNDRRLSEGHKAIPLPSPEFVLRLPMVVGLVEQMGLSIEDVVSPSRDRKRIVELAQRTYDVFHVADARGSGHVPAQAFVERYGIRSALGFGGVLYTGDFFSVVLFSRVPVSQPVADTVRILSLATRVALMPFGSRVFD